MKVRLQHQGGGPMPPTWDQIHRDETERIAEMIAALSWRDPVLRRRLAKYLDKLQLESPVPAE